MRQVTTSELWEETVKVAREQPDTAIDGICQYVDEGIVYDSETQTTTRVWVPSCLIGTAWARLVPVEELATELILLGDNDANIDVVRTSLLANDDQNAMNLLARAQSIQDTGNPWGEAVIQALEDDWDDDE